MEIIVTAKAARDLVEIDAYISQDSPGAAERFISRLVATFYLLADGKLHGPDVRFARGGQAQRWSAPPYRIYYRRTRSRTVIVRVYHQSRRSIEA